MTDFSKDFEKYLNLYLDNRLDDSEKKAFEEYLKENPEKELELKLYQNLESSARMEEIPDLPDGYWDGLGARIDARIEREDIGTESKKGLPGFFKQYVLSFHNGMKIAAAALTIITVVLISRQFIGETSLLDLADIEKSESVDEVISDTMPPLKVMETELDRDDVRSKQDTQDNLLLSDESGSAEEFVEEKSPPPVVSMKKEDEEKQALEKSMIIGDTVLKPSPEALQDANIISKMKNEKTALDSEDKIKSLWDHEPVESVVAQENKTPNLVDMIDIQVNDSLVKIRGGRSGEIQYKVDGVIENTEGVSADSYPGKEVNLLSDEGIGIQKTLTKKDIDFDDSITAALEKTLSKADKQYAESYRKQRIGTVDSIKIVGDSLVNLYFQAKEETERKDLIARIIDKHIELAKLSGSPQQSNKCKMLIDKAYRLKMIDFQEYNSYNESLK